MGSNHFDCAQFYKATPDGGLVAIKTLAEHLAEDRSIVGRFPRETRMAAALGNPPNIVPVFDIGEANRLSRIVDCDLLGSP